MTKFELTNGRWALGRVMVILLIASALAGPPTVAAQGDGDEGFYESPTYGYTLTYDPEAWEVAGDDQNPDDPYDRLLLSSVGGDSMLLLIGDPDYYNEDELDRCVAEYLAGLEAAGGVTDVEPLDERGAEGEKDDRAWGTFTYSAEDNRGGEDEFVRYIECRWLGDGVTVVVLHVASADNYEDEVEARDELLEGLEPAHGASDARGTGDEEAAPLDLAAMALSPADLEAEGFEGYGIVDGDGSDPAGVASALAFQRGLPEAEVAQLFADSGLRQAYTLRLDRRSRTDDLALSVVTTVQEYSDADGAADAFAALTDWEDVDTAAPVAEHDAIADESVLTRHRGTTGEPFHALDLAFRHGHVTAIVRLIDFTGDRPAVADAERLAERLLERIEAQLDVRATGIDTQALRLTGDGVIRNWEYYTIADGAARRLVDATAEETDAYEERVTEAGMTDEFMVGHRIVLADVPAEDGYLYTIVQRFDDADAASTYLNSALDAMAKRGEAESLEELDGLAVFGDEAIAYVLTERWESEDIDLFYQSYYLRVDDRLALIQLVAPREFSEETLEELAAAQATCLEEAACGGPAPLPADIEAAIRTAEREPPGTTIGMVPAEETWRSQTFEVELRYDPSAWQDWTEQLLAPGDGDTLVLFDVDEQSILTLEVLVDDQGAGACVDDLTADFVEREALGMAIPIKDPRGDPVAERDDELAYAAYGFVLDDGDRTFGYVECRAFDGEDAVVTIFHVGPLEEYDDLAEARDDLLAGLVLPRS